MRSYNSVLRSGRDNMHLSLGTATNYPYHNGTSTLIDTNLLQKPQHNLVDPI